MQHDVAKLLRTMMEVGQLKQAGLAKRLGNSITQPQISRWLAGQEPELSNYQRVISVAETMGVLTDMRSEDVAAALRERAGVPMVKLKGYVGAGSEAHFYALADEDFEEVPAPPGAVDQTVAVEIKGTSMGPALNSWLVFYDDVRSPIEDNMLNRLCVVGLADDRILVKKVERVRNGRLRLISNNPEEPPIDDVVIEWAALVSSMRPR